MSKVIVIFSGGVDSFVLLNKALSEGHEVSALSFNYGQRHVKELAYAEDACARRSVPHRVVDLTALRPLLSASALTGGAELPTGHYADPSMRATVVPNRNAVMLMVATGYAITQRANEVWIGAHAGDRAIYPDCRAEFIELVDAVAQVANDHPVRIRAPFLDIDKVGILALALNELHIPLEEFEFTWTCYAGLEVPCGACGSCVERAEAFAKNGVIDPAIRGVLA